MLTAGNDKELRTRIGEIIIDNTQIADEFYGDENIRVTQAYLDIDNAITHILAELDKRGYHIGLPSSIEWALNSGDGVYRP